MTDVERSTFYHEKFGDIMTYSFLPKHPAFDHCAVLANGRRFTVQEWREFQHYVLTSGCKVKASWHNGLILIEECNMHATHVAGLFEVNGKFFMFNRAAGEMDGVLGVAGQGECHVGNSYIMPDTSYIPIHGNTPSFYMEVANTQHVLTLINKVEQLLHHSHNNRYTVILKVWRNPNPNQVAIVIAVWLKVGDTATPAEREAIVFTSFGTRPPTNDELAPFAVAPAGFTPWVPALTGVINGPGSVPCIAANELLPEYNITFQTATLLNVPNVATPDEYLLLPDINISLYQTQCDVIRGMVTDITRGLWNLNNAELGQIVNNVNPNGIWRRLYNFAVALYNPPTL
jgi:hypothetical protein